MKANIHPNCNNEVKVTCACGSTFSTGSTMEQIRVEICSACHPLYTGQAKFVDTLGQVERFQKKVELSKQKQAERQQILQARASKIENVKRDRPSLKDLLMSARKSS